MISQATKFINCTNLILNSLESLNESLGNIDEKYSIPISYIPMAREYVLYACKYKMLDSFIEETRHLWDKIYKEDTVFFIEYFSGIEYGKEFVPLIEGAIKEEYDLKYLWMYFKTAVKISIVHLHIEGEKISREEFEKWGIKIK